MSDKKDRPPRLGRGLVSLLGHQGPEPQDADRRRTLPIASLSPGPFQPRRNMGGDALNDLVESIRAHGVLQPILVRPAPRRPASFEIIAGERRWRAAQEAGLHDVPVYIRELDDVTALAAALIENLQREDLNAMEEAEGLKRLADEFGLTQELVSNSIGKSRSHVANTIRLLSLPATVQHEVRRGVLSAGHARALLMHPDPTKAAMIVLSRGLNVRQTEAMVKSFEADIVRSPRQDTSPDISAWEAELTADLGLQTSLTWDGSKGQVKIRFKSLEQLDNLSRLLKRPHAGRK